MLTMRPPEPPCNTSFTTDFLGDGDGHVGDGDNHLGDGDGHVGDGGAGFVFGNYDIAII